MFFGSSPDSGEISGFRFVVLVLVWIIMAMQMNVGMMGVVPFGQIGRISGGFEASKGKNFMRNQWMDDINTESSEWGGNFFVMAVELRKKILAFRDILDLPPCSASASINELLLGTVEDLHKLYPRHVASATPSFPPSQVIQKSISEGLLHFYQALKSVRDSWAETRKLDSINNKFRDENDDNMKNINLQQLGERVLNRLEDMSGLARTMFDLMEEEDQKNGITFENQQSSRFGDFLRDSFSDNKDICGSPHTPTSVLPESSQSSFSLSSFMNAAYSPPMLLPLRLQAVGKLKPIDVKRLSFHLPVNTQVQTLSRDETGKTKEDSKTGSPEDVKITEASSVKLDDFDISKTGQESTPIQNKPNLIVDEQKHKVAGDGGSKVAPIKNIPTVPVPPPPMVKIGFAPPPLPPLGVIKNIPTVPVPPPPMAKIGFAPPPPPPLGVMKSLRPRKTNSKLMRSTQMGNLYRLLKGKVEGSRANGKSSRGSRNQMGASGSDKKQSMADALAEMTRRSSYFQQIEEDVKKHATTIIEMKSAIDSFQTKDMAELLKFHSYVELHLEDLTDETQVLARFDGFPTKKLETIRTASTLYSRLNAIATNLESWKNLAPLSRQLDKVECYFDKIKIEVDALERTKDEEAKRFQSSNISFDFNVLLRIKESMVDVSSNCIEIALQESKEIKKLANGENEAKAEARLKACSQILWRAFQLAFRVYTFAGGQDDRAEKLTSELAKEIETYPQH